MTGRYQHLTQELSPAAVDEAAGLPQALSYAGSSVHGRTLLFIVVALLVGAGLLSIVPNLSASGDEPAVPDASSIAADPVKSAPVADTRGEDAATAPEVEATVTGAISPIFTREWEPPAVKRVG